MSSARRKKVQYMVYMEPAKLGALRQLSERTGVPIAVYIRRAVDELLKSSGVEVDGAGFEGLPRDDEPLGGLSLPMLGEDEAGSRRE